MKLVGSGCFWGSRGGLGGRSREVDGLDGTRRTLGHTFAARLAFVEIDIGHVVLDMDGLKRTCFLTLATADACIVASLACLCTLFLVDATHIDPAVLATFVAQFNHTARTGFGAGAASSALLLVHGGCMGLGVYRDGSKLASLHTTAQSQAAERTTILSRIKAVRKSTVLQTVIVGHRLFTDMAGATADDRHLRFGRLGDTAQDGCHLLRHGITTGGTFQTFHIALLGKSLGHGTATGLAAATAVGARKDIGNQINQGILLNFELLGHKIEQYSKKGSSKTQNKNSN